MSDAAPPRVLIVDDTAAIHESIRAVLGTAPGAQGAQDALDALEADLFDEAPAAPAKPAAGSPTYEIDSAMQGQEALARVRASLAEGRPYAVAFVDMRMPPGWDGLTTIQHLWAADPAIQIVICTAYSDRSWSEIRDTLGNTDQLLILKKPFDPVEVAQLAHSLSQKWFTTAAERALLEQTLGASVGVMGELLALISPVASDRVLATRPMVRHMAEALGLTHWAYDLAAGMAQIGCLMLPVELVQNDRAGRELSARDQRMFDRHPSVGAGLIRQIPRLGVVADIVDKQLAPPTVQWDRLHEDDAHAIASVGSHLLHTALAVDRAVYSGDELPAACRRCATEGHPTVLIDAMASFRAPAQDAWIHTAVTLSRMKPGMTLEEPVTTPSGTVVCPAATRITVAMVERLHNFAVRVGSDREFRVRVPAASVAGPAGRP